MKGREYPDLIDQARKHAKDVGGGQPVALVPIQKSRLDYAKVDHFLDFISQPEFLQDVAYGTKTLKLSHGAKLEIPNVVRSVISSRIIDLYLAYCTETGFSALKRTSLYSILQVRLHSSLMSWGISYHGTFCGSSFLLLFSSVSVLFLL